MSPLTVGVTSSVFFCANLRAWCFDVWHCVGVTRAGERQLQRLATVDALTDTWNRATVEKLANAALEKSAPLKTPVSLVLGDIDHFKR
jgi:GGDEF domain-containing protein